jgi:hypothetical protein
MFVGTTSRLDNFELGLRVRSRMFDITPAVVRVPKHTNAGDNGYDPRA